MSGKRRDAVCSGVHWEELAGYSRAVRIDDRILVSGTTASGPDGLAVEGGAREQTGFVIDKIEQSIVQLGGCLKDIVRTRVFVTDIRHCEEISRVLGDRFRDIRPANTLVEAKLAGEEYLVEIEAEAVIGAGDAL